MIAPRLSRLAAPLAVYVAAPLERIDQARNVASEITRIGAGALRVVSTWHNDRHLTREGERSAQPWELARAFAANEAEITRADVLVALGASAGRETLIEIGIALANGCRVLAVDAVRLASYSRPDVEWIDPCEGESAIGAILAELAE